MDCRKTKIDVFAYVNSNEVSVFSKCLLKLITIFLHLHESIIFSSRHFDMLCPVRIARPLGTSFSLHNFYFRRGQTFAVGVHKLLPWMFTNFCHGCSQTFAVYVHKLLPSMFTNFCRDVDTSYCCRCLQELLSYIFSRCR